MKTLAAKLTLREMTSTDVDAVHELDQRCFTLPWPKKSFNFEVQENQAAHNWVAEAEENGVKKIVGMIVCWLLVDEIHIATIAVDAAYRRQRIASTLICRAFSELIPQGARSATLEVRAGNAAAQAMYRRFGFQLAGRRPAYYRDNGEDAILMTLYTLDADHLKNIACQE